MLAWVLLVLSLGLIAVCGVFVAAEFALLTVDRSHVERAAADGDKAAGGVLAALRTLSGELSGVQVAITLTNLGVGFLAEPALAGLLRGPLRGVGVTGEAVSAVSVAIALVVSTMLTMLFGELVPKNLAIAAPFAVARAVQAPVRAFTRTMRLPIRALNATANAILALFGMRTREELASARSPEELMSLVRHSARTGTLAEGTATLLLRSLTFGDKRARDVLTARVRMRSVAATDTVEQVLALVRDSGHSRLPVTGPGGLDEIVGVVELDQAVRVAPERRSRVRAEEVMAPAVEVPETLPIDAVLQTLRARRCQLVIVVDEYGGVAGLVTGEDLLEELVGELDDEHDVPAGAVRPVAGGYDVSGLLRPDEVQAATGLRLPSSGGYETVAGLLLRELGRIPQAGDRVVVDEVVLDVLRMDERRVDRIRVAPAADTDASQGSP